MSSERRRLILQLSLFVVTVITTTLAGSEWTYGKSILMRGYSWSDFASGFEFSIPFLFILTVHEFGHYFTARYHKVRVTLPYYLPLPPPFLLGTLGAVIRLGRASSKRQNFDIGIAGPIAGFVVALLFLCYAFTHLPEPEYIFKIHPEYQQYGLQYADHVYKNLPEGALGISVGKNLLFLFFEKFVADPSRIPNPHELIHYPFLFAGFMSLVFTSLNLFPIGQLDGGHVSYGLFGFKIHKMIATLAFFVLLLYSGVGLIELNTEDEFILLKVGGFAVFLYFALFGLGLPRKETLMYSLLVLAVILILGWIFPALVGYPSWLIFMFIVGRFIGIQYPPSEIEDPLDNKRIVLGWIALIIFIISFSPAPLVFIQSL